MSSGDSPDPKPARTAHDLCTSEDDECPCPQCNPLCVDNNFPIVEVRMAQCAMNCGSTRPSDPTLPFFWGKPDEAFDSYYDGCLPGIGWD
jgi:hypothetical protein